jgi:hypothetical protein
MHRDEAGESLLGKSALLAKSGEALGKVQFGRNLFFRETRIEEGSGTACLIKSHMRLSDGIRES